MMRWLVILRWYVVIAVLAAVLPIEQSTEGQVPETRIVASTDGLPAALRPEPSGEAAPLGHLQNGTEVWLHGTVQSIELGEWGLVEDGAGQRGFIALGDLRAPEEARSLEPVPPTPTPRRELTYVVQSAATAPSVRSVVAASTPTPSRSTPSSNASALGSSDEQAPAGGVRRPVAQSRLDSRLSEMSRTLLARGQEAAAAEARQAGLRTDDGRVLVVIETRPGTRPAVAQSLSAIGARTEAEYAQLIQARVPISALSALASQGNVVRVAPPAAFVPEAVTGEEIAASQATAWHAAGITGAGVRVAVIDSGFAGLAARQASGDLPSSVVTQDFCNGGFSETATAHGTGVAEIVHEMAPGARLYLICADTQVRLGQATEYAKSQGVHIISHSVSWFNTSRGDGSGGPGTPDAIVEDARANGILWVNSAGNRAQRHWTGTFSDTDGDDFHNYTSTDEGNSYTIAAGDQSCVFMKWDGWPATSQDFDLYLARASDNAAVAVSLNIQDGSQPPTEALCFINSAATQSFYVAIAREGTTSTPRIDVFTFGGGSLQYQTAAGSVTEPASAPEAVAAGAICWQTNNLEPFSSRGPTIDGRVKPDIAGQDGVSSATFGSFSSCASGSGFFGTSAAAPAVAGAAALVKQANPSFSPAQLQAFLEGRAVDQGDSGKDNLYGAGRLSLGAPPVTPTPTSTPVPCPSPRPDLPRFVTELVNGRLQVTVGAGHLSLVSITALKLTEARVELPGGTLTTAGQSLPLSSTSTTFFVQRTREGGPYTAEISIQDGCGSYPLLFGAGS